MSTWPFSSIFKEWLLDFFFNGYIDGNPSLAHPLQRPRDVDGPGVPGFRDRPAMSEPSFSKVWTRAWEKCQKAEFWKRCPPENYKMAIKHHHFCYIGRLRYIVLMILFPLWCEFLGVCSTGEIVEGWVASFADGWRNVWILRGWCHLNWPNIYIVTHYVIFQILGQKDSWYEWYVVLPLWRLVCTLL